MVTTDQITAVAKDNLFLLFGETSKEKRLQQYERLWHPSGSFLFVEPNDVCTTYEQIDEVISKLQTATPGFVFSVIRDIQILAIAGEETNARLKWGFGPPGEDFKVTGEDVFTFDSGKIKKLLTFID